jgi:hypothetical protein
VGVVAWRSNSGARLDVAPSGSRRFTRFSGADGLSDVVGLVPLPGAGGKTHGVFLAVECKRAGKAPTAKQAGFLAKVRAAGGIAVVAHSVDELRAALAAAGFVC